MMDWAKVSLDRLLDYVQPTNYIVESTDYSDDYNVPVLTAGKTFIKGFTNETKGVFTNLPVIIFDDFTTATQFVKFQFKVKSSAMKILVPKVETYSLYLIFLWMQCNPMRSDTHKRYWISTYSKRQIPLPPLPEQRAIVKKIESLFSELDHGIASLKQAQVQLKIYRQAVLKKAFEGKYTEEKNYGNSDDLDSYVFEIKNAKESYFQLQLKCWLEEKLFWEQSNSNKSKPRKPSRSPIIEISKDVVDNLPKLKSNWEWKTLSHVTLQIGDIDHKMPKTIDDGIPYLSTGDIGKGHGLRFETAKQISVVDYKRLSLKIKPDRNDIIFPRYGTIGRNIIVETDRDFLVSYSCAILKNIPELVNHKFIYYYTLSPLAIKEIERNVVQTTQANIGIKSIQGFHLPFCLKEEQNQIVQEIESRLSVCDHIEASIIENLEKSEALRQSILKKAFAGKLLTREELTACKKEKDWCTGAALLDRIKNEEKNK